VHSVATGSWHQISVMVLAIAVACGIYLGSYALRVLWSHFLIHVPIPVIIRALPFLGMSVLISPSVLARERRPPIHYRSDGPFHAPPWDESGDAITIRKPTRGRQPAIPHRSGQPSAAPPWSEPRGYSPPHPLGRAGADAAVMAQKNFDDHNEGAPTRPHSRGGSGGGRDATGPTTYVVRAGDCLWTIAAEWLETDDAGRIARYWPRIHRANRATIGRDPSIIHPGQVLVMPDEDDRVSGG
jgi:hypothetical protein